MSTAGLDIGSTGAKITVVNGGGTVVHTGYLDYPISRTASAHEVDARQIWATVRRLLQGAAAEDREIGAVGVTSFGESFVLTDASGDPLLPTMLYTDPRGSEEAAQLTAALSDDQIFRITGATPHAMFTLPKLMWVKRSRPEVYRKARFVFLIADYIAYLLTGERAIDYSLAARTLGFDIQRLCWSGPLFQAAGLNEEMFSAPVPSGSVAGVLQQELARELGLGERTQIVVCGHDQVAAAVGSGILTPGGAANGAGTVECVTPVFRGIPIGGAMQKNHYPVVPFPGKGLYCCYAFTFTGGSLLDWLIGRFYGGETERRKREGKSVYAELEAGMKDAPTGILVLPHFAGAATPYMDPGAKGAFTGLTLSHTNADLYRAVMEGIACEVRLNLERLRESGVTVRSLNASGGGARSKAWLQIKADVLGLPVNRLSNGEAGTVGGILLTALAQGMFGSLEEAAQAMVRIEQTFEPRQGMRERYDEQYGRYQGLYKALRPLAADDTAPGRGDRA